jgi:nitroreductase/NAD-dependent dihydropyrimidine dehydrogenase PreA subunit
MPDFFIQSETCCKCGICAQICPASVIEKNNSGIVFKPDFIHLCLGCGQCMAACKTKSIHAKGLAYDKDFFEFSGQDDFFSMIETRRSVRRFKPQPLNKDEINKILDAVSFAPHGDAEMHVEVTVINDRKKIMQALPVMSHFFDKLAKWLKNPFMRSLIKKRKGKHTLNTLLNHLLPRIEKGIYRQIDFNYDGITRGAHTLLLFHAHKEAEEHIEDAHIYVTYAMLAAQAMGLGTTIIGLVPAAMNKTPDLMEMFSIPKGHEIVVSLILGYPKYKYYRAVKRQLKRVNWID